MAKRKGARKGGHISRPKQLRKRLRKAEAQLVEAAADRNKSQARVEALAIIADEIRAQLAEAERATAGAEAASSRATAAGRTTPNTKPPTAPKPSRAATGSPATKAAS